MELVKTYDIDLDISYSYMWLYSFVSDVFMCDFYFRKVENEI